MDDLVKPHSLLPKSALREEAEKIVHANEEESLKNLSALSPEETRQMLHELHVHQIELEMQNEELLRVEITLDAERERYFDLYDLAPVGYCTLTTEGLILQTNLTAATLLGVARGVLVTQMLSSFVIKDDQDIYYLYRKQLVESGQHHSCELRMAKNDGSQVWVHLSATTVQDKGISLLRFVLSDISERKKHENQLEHVAHYDVLTALPNRTLLADRLHQGMAQAIRHDQSIAVIYLDLDGFKEINDTYGHDVGDRLLIFLSTYIKETMREGDTLARLGGDEFVAVLLDLATIKECVPMLDRILTAASQPVYIDDLAIKVSASIGVTFYPQSKDVDADQLLRQADYAMYQAKLAGKNRYHVFDTKQNDSIREHYEIIASIQLAMDRHEFILYYQPKVNMRTGIIIGAEALIRWQHPQQGLLSPLEFLPEIEDHPLMVEIGEWVIHTALTQMEQWHLIGVDLPVSVNISARQLQQSDFVECLSKILSQHPNVKSSCLELEVLETSKLEDLLRTSQVIEECLKLGVLFALDDFGTGYSSLTYLKHLPVALLKIDQSFVRGMIDNPDDLAILKGVIGLASAFRREVIAEGVETIEHGKILMELGCDLAQGYAIARPMPADEFPNWSAIWHPDPSWANISLIH